MLVDTLPAGEEATRVEPDEFYLDGAEADELLAEAEAELHRADDTPATDGAPESNELSVPAPEQACHRADHGLIVTNLADVEPEDREWLWAGRFPLGRITVIVGRPGEGKSVLSLSMAADISTGRPWPDGAQCEQGKVLLVSAEDGVADDLVPRLMVHDADRSMIDHVVTIVDRNAGKKDTRRMLTLHDVDRIEKLIEGGDYRAIIIDPIGSFIGGRTDAHRDNEMRAVLTPLADMAARHRVAVIVIMHYRKSPGEHADDMALGTRAFIGIARASWHVVTDAADPDRRLMLPGKINCAKRNGGMAFRLVSATPNGMKETQPCVKWDGMVSMTADEHMASTRSGPGPEPEARNEAERWLIELLTPGEREVGDPEKPADGTIRTAAKAAGMSWATVRRAKDSLAGKGFSVRSEPNPFTKRYQWRLAKIEPTPKQAAA